MCQGQSLLLLLGYAKKTTKLFSHNIYAEDLGETPIGPWSLRVPMSPSQMSLWTCSHGGAVLDLSVSSNPSSWFSEGLCGFSLIFCCRTLHLCPSVAGWSLSGLFDDSARLCPRTHCLSSSGMTNYRSKVLLLSWCPNPSTWGLAGYSRWPVQALYCPLLGVFAGGE